MSNREARNERDTTPEPATETAAAGTRSMTGPLELPSFDSGDIVIRNAEGRYTLRYDTAYRQASWVAYVLTGEDAAPGQAKRRDRFVPDPTVVKAGYPTATIASYKGSGYDRGHLCPSADRSRSQEENDCTFYLSNIAPQTPALNRGPWKELEEQARRWAVRCDTLYIVAGGVLTSGLDTLPSGIGGILLQGDTGTRGKRLRGHRIPAAERNALRGRICGLCRPDRASAGFHLPRFLPQSAGQYGAKGGKGVFVPFLVRTMR